MKEITVTDAEAGQRLDKLLKKVFREAKESFLYKMLRKKNILLNEKKAEGKELLKEGDKITIYLSDDTYALMSGEKTGYFENRMKEYRKAYDSLKNIEVIYEDENILVMNKPKGLLSQKAEEGDLTLNEWMVGYLLAKKEMDEETLHTFIPSVLNRLDRNTCGLIIGSKTLAGSQFVSSLIKNRNIHKYYRCVVEGDCDLSGIYPLYLYKDKRKNQVSIYPDKNFIPEKIRHEAHAIQIGITPVLSRDGCTELEIELFTGKTHQIRAVLSYLGFPIVGDVKYGKEKGQTMGQLLCSYRLKFPKIEEDSFIKLSELELTCPAPDFLLTNGKE